LAALRRAVEISATKKPATKGGSSLIGIGLAVSSLGHLAQNPATYDPQALDVVDRTTGRLRYFSCLKRAKRHAGCPVPQAVDVRVEDVLRITVQAL
jgi:hypothetical protein